MPPLLEDCNMQLRRAPRIRPGPLLFVIYVSPVGDLIKSHGVSHHQYADDTQLFLAIKASFISADLAKLDSCSQAVKGWFAVNNLMLKVIIGRAVDWYISPVARRRSYFGDCGYRREPKACGSNQVTWRYLGQSFDFCCSCYSCVQGL